MKPLLLLDDLTFKMNHTVKSLFLLGLWSTFHSTIKSYFLFSTRFIFSRRKSLVSYDVNT